MALFFDTETNGYGGFRPPTQRLVQLAWSIEDESQDHLVDDVERVNPEVPHDHTPERCKRDGIPFSQLFDSFMVDLRRCTKIVAHNLAFDWGVIEHELRVRGMHGPIAEFNELMKSKSFCTMKTTTDMCRLPSKSVYFKGFKYPKLSELYAHLFGAPPDEEQLGKLHDAMVDVRVLQLSYQELCNRGLVSA